MRATNVGSIISECLGEILPAALAKHVETTVTSAFEKVLHNIIVFFFNVLLDVCKRGTSTGYT